jgi:hypothetical protein
MELIEEHRTPDGLLTFKVGREQNGDVCFGFEDYGWHTHADTLSSLSGLPEDAAVRKFVDALINNRSIIAIARVENKIRDVWIADNSIPDQYKPENETIEFRFWNGRPAA